VSSAADPESRHYGPYEVRISRPDKELFPESGITKRDLVDHAERVAEVMLPHVEDRPVTMHRFPDGIGAEGFYHKAMPDHFPDWVRHVRVPRKSGGAIEQVVIANQATLVLLADQGCITPHVGLARADDLETPDRLVWDLDPADSADDPFGDVRFAARRLLESLDDLALPGFVQTTGSRGLHVVVPIRRTVGFDRARGFGRRLSRRIAERHEDRLTLAARKDVRGRRLYLDVEADTFFRSANLRQKVRLAVQHPDQPRELETRLVLSLHDFTGRPRDLHRQLARMADEPAAAVLKVAWMARSVRDNLEAFDLLRGRTKPTIALCMGPFGRPSRILAPKFCGFATFAGHEADRVTAPGQPSREELARTYRITRIGPETRVFGLVGWPVEHSLGPVLHNAHFEAADRDAVYVPFPIGPGWETFTASLDALLDYEPLHLRGLSVTRPHKENLLRWARERRDDVTVDPVAADAGAANTIVVEEAGGRISVTNTDVPALVDPVLAALGRSGPDAEDLKGLRIAVVGAGGVARAAVSGFSRRGATVILYNRTREHADALAAEFAERPDEHDRPRRVVSARLEKLCDSCAHAFVNATPVGQVGGPDPEGSPIPLEEGARPGWTEQTVVMDTVYRPVRTPLLRAAEDAGCRVVTGLAMFVAQAKRQAAAWHPEDHDPRRFDVVARAVLDEA